MADLIELVFADSMDGSGRSAIREMRYLSHMGYGLNLISHMNDLALGISLGFVYVEDGNLIGNVSVYPASYPRDLGETWILANVAVHPEYQRQGIAKQLVEASMEMIEKRGGRRVILQVNYDNVAAQRLYERYGFIYERAWNWWRRSGFMRSPLARNHDLQIRRLRQREWAAELELARAARPNSRGGLGWLKPVHKSEFCTPLWKRVLNQIALNKTEKLIIRDEETCALLASCWVESAVSFGDIRARLFTAPAIDHRPYAEALLDNLVTRFERSTIMVEHPRDDDVANDLLHHHQFKIKRELWHMRLDV